MSSKAPLILVADDQEAVRNTVARLLSLEGYRYEIAANGQRAWEVLERCTIDLALLDINMPGIDGIGLIERMQASALLRRIPVIMITGSVDSASVLRCKALGVTDYIVKPYKIANLLARVEAALEKATSERVQAQSGHDS